MGPNDGPAHGGVGGVKGGAPSVSPALSQSQHPAIHLPYAGRGTDDGDADDVAPPAATGTTLAALSKLQSSVTGKGSCGLVGEQHGAVARLRDARVQWWVGGAIFPPKSHRGRLCAPVDPLCTGLASKHTAAIEANHNRLEELEKRLGKMLTDMSALVTSATAAAAPSELVNVVAPALKVRIGGSV